MKEIIFTENDFEIWKEDEKYFAIYDAGSHQVVMRKDEISETDAKIACAGNPQNLTKILFALQAQLIKSGIDPYESNI